MANYDGTVYSREDFVKHIDSIPDSDLGWIDFGAIHNTGAPNISQQKATKGGASQRMRNAKPDADKRLGGKGAHYWCFHTGEIGKACPLPLKGAHSPAWNKKAFGIEMVADFDGTDDPESEDGKVLVDTAAFVFATILRKCKLPATDSTIRLHKEDTTTSHDCPGKLFKKKQFIEKVNKYMAEFPSFMGKEPKPSTEVRPPKATDKPKTAYDIRTIQKLVAKAGFAPGALDGKWGPKTEAAVKAYQKAKGLKVDGVVGPITWASLNQPVSTPVEEPKPVVVEPKPVETPKVEEPKPVEPEKPKDDGLRAIEELHPSEQAINWMKRFEGLRLKAYDDVGSWAIGYGHNATSKRPPIPYEGMTITEAEAIDILHKDAEAMAAEVRKVLKGVKVTQDLFDALVLDDFQRGMTQFAKTPVVKALKEGGDWVKAFTDQAKHTNAGVTRRRKVQVEIALGKKPTKW